MLLAGDIGGTKTNLAIYPIEGDVYKPVAEKTFPSDEYPSLQALAAEFLQSNLPKIHYACFGVAGPVVEGHVRATNLPWEMDEAELGEALGLDRVFLLNDLEAVANAVPRLKDDDLVTINPGDPEAGGSMAVIAPGTGLGEAFLAWDGVRYRAYPSEGGHTDFGPANALQCQLLDFWRSRKSHVSYEMVCSGIGIGNIYTFLKETNYAPEPAWLAAQLEEAEDQTPLIVNTALTGDVALCDATLDMFVSILGAESGNLALSVLATGGLYLGGGIPPRILPALQDGQFMEAFLHKGRMAEVLKRVPVKVILNAKSALLGAAAYGLEMARS